MSLKCTLLPRDRDFLSSFPLHPRLRQPVEMQLVQKISTQEVLQDIRIGNFTANKEQTFRPGTAHLKGCEFRLELRTGRFIT